MHSADKVHVQCTNKKMVQALKGCRTMRRAHGDSAAGPPARDTRLHVTLVYTRHLTPLGADLMSYNFWHAMGGIFVPFLVALHDSRACALQPCTNNTTFDRPGTASCCRCQRVRLHLPAPPDTARALNRNQDPNLLIRKMLALIPEVEVDIVGDGTGEESEARSASRSVHRGSRSSQGQAQLLAQPLAQPMRHHQRQHGHSQHRRPIIAGQQRSGGWSSAPSPASDEHAAEEGLRADNTNRSAAAGTFHSPPAIMVELLRCDDPSRPASGTHCTREMHIYIYIYIVGLPLAPTALS